MRTFRVWLKFGKEAPTSCIVKGTKLTKVGAKREVQAQAPSAKIGLIEAVDV